MDEKENMADLNSLLTEELPDVFKSEFNSEESKAFAQDDNAEKSDVAVDIDDVFTAPDFWDDVKETKSDIAEETVESSGFNFDFSDLMSDDTADELDLTDVISGSTTELDVTLEDGGNYSESFLEDETTKFLKDLNITLTYRSNPVGINTMLEPRTKQIVSAKKEKKYTEFIGVMKELLSSIQQYNETHNVDVLPVNLRQHVDGYGPLVYDSSVVFDEFKKQAMSLAGNDGTKRNRILSELSDMREIFKSYCMHYVELDKYNNKAIALRDQMDRAVSREFAFYKEIERRLLDGGELVTLCNELIFNKDNAYKYKFKCGHCNTITSGVSEIYNGNGDKVVEPDSNGFYQLLTKEARSLHYPMVCEHCGRINVLSASSRRLIAENIKRPPTETSRDKSDYISDNVSKNGKQSIGNRRWLPKDKWMDLLESKLVIDEEDAYNRISEADSGDAGLDSIFYITEDDMNTALEGYISEVDNDSYRNAIKAFRNKNDIYNCKVEIDNNTESLGVKPMLASIMSSGSVILLNGIYNAVAGYIVSTNSFKKLAKLQEAKTLSYDRYLTLHSALKFNLDNEDIQHNTIESFEKEFKVKFNASDLSSAVDEALKEYEEAKAEYLSFRDKVYKCPAIFAFKRKEKVSNALKDVAEAFDFDSYFPEFMDCVVQETIINLTMVDTVGSLGVKYKGKKVVAEPVSGLSPIKDRKYKQANKYKSVKEYTNRIAKAYKAIDNGFKKCIDEFHRDYTIYLAVDEMKSLYNLDNSTKIKSLLSNGSILAHYMREFHEHYGDINKFEENVVGDMIPQFNSREYFQLFFNGDISDNTVMSDATYAFNKLLVQSGLNIYDLLFDRMVISRIGYVEAIGMSNMDMATYLKLANGLVVNCYNNNKANLLESIGEKAKQKYYIRNILSHRFLHYRNDQASVDILNLYLTGDDEAIDAGYEELQRQLDFVTEELKGAKYIDVEYPNL